MASARITTDDETGTPSPHVSLLSNGGGGILPRFLLRTTGRGLTPASFLIVAGTATGPGARPGLFYTVAATQQVRVIILRANRPPLRITRKRRTFPPGPASDWPQIGRASCRERVCTYV